MTTTRFENFEWLEDLDGGRFRFLKPITLTVCLAIDRDDSQVAAKRTLEAGPDGWPTYDNPADEARPLRELRHPNLVEFVAHYPKEGVLVTRFVPGENLARRYFLRPCTEEEACEILIEVAKALCYLHVRKLLHRDLTPANVVSADGRVVLIDLGAAVRTEGRSEPLLPKTILGIELVHRELWARPPDDEYGPESDLYALGMLGAYLLTGIPPSDHRIGGPAFLLGAKPYDSPLRAILRKALNDSRHDRYISADAILADLAECLTSMRKRTSALLKSEPLDPQPDWPTVTDVTGGSDVTREAHVDDNVTEAPNACKACGCPILAEHNGEITRHTYCASCSADPETVLRDLLLRTMKTDLPLLPGYSILKELGRGGMVDASYLARHEQSGQLVTLKLIQASRGPNSLAVRAFLREMENAKCFTHPNLIGVLDSGCVNDSLFLTYEYCEGRSVSDRMQTHGGTLQIDDATSIILQVLDGLNWLHCAEFQGRLQNGTCVTKRGLVHRNLTPVNILLHQSDDQLIAKLTGFDLGISHDAAGYDDDATLGGVAGHPPFIPRQQVINFKYAKPEVDVWAASACLYNMLTDSFPRDFLPGRDPWQTILNTDAVPIRRRKASIPAKLAEVIDTALVDRPEIQVKSAADLKKALEDAWRWLLFLT